MYIFCDRLSCSFQPFPHSFFVCNREFRYTTIVSPLIIFCQGNVERWGGIQTFPGSSALPAHCCGSYHGKQLFITKKLVCEQKRWCTDFHSRGFRLILIAEWVGESDEGGEWMAVHRWRQREVRSIIFLTITPITIEQKWGQLNKNTLWNTIEPFTDRSQNIIRCIAEAPCFTLPRRTISRTANCSWSELITIFLYI